MTVSDIAKAIEEIAPLRLQEDYDNSGLQVGFPGSPVRRVLVTLDITEEIIDEAVAEGCQMVVSHHPLLFHPLKQVSDASWQQRCVVKALANGIAIYSAHTNLDNARGGVNFEMAERLGLRNLAFLQPKPGEDAGSGLIGELETPMTTEEFTRKLKTTFNVACLRCSDTNRKTISRVALCGGAGAFLIDEAKSSGADAFITGEIHYHDFFENDGMLLCALGHYESEQYTMDLLSRILSTRFPDLEIIRTTCISNPIVSL